MKLTDFGDFLMIPTALSWGFGHVCVLVKYLNNYPIDTYDFCSAVGSSPAGAQWEGKRHVCNATSSAFTAESIQSEKSMSLIPCSMHWLHMTCGATFFRSTIAPLLNHPWLLQPHIRSHVKIILHISLAAGTAKSSVTVYGSFFWIKKVTW